MNRKLLINILMCLIAFPFAACNEKPAETITNQSNTYISSSSEVTSAVNTQDILAQVKLTFDDTDALLILYDNETSRDFLSMLPLTLTLKDFNETEKIAYLPRELTIDNQPDGFDPDKGDFAYYAPWGNLSIFYEDFRYSEDLISLGYFEYGIDALTTISSDFTVIIEQLDE